MLPPLYDLEAVRPMEEELTSIGVRALKTPAEVAEFLNPAEGTALVVINSVCGCAAGGARPGVTRALQHARIPDRSATVFAGVHREAVEAVREHLTDFIPSSPFVALFAGGKVVFVLQRRDIERLDQEGVARELIQAFDRFCTAEGPLASPDQLRHHHPVRACGSKIPPYQA